MQIEAVKMMVKAARQYLVVDNDWRCFHAVFAAEFPNNAPVVFVQAIDIAVGRRKVDATVANRRLTRPGGSAPRIFMQAATHEFRLHFPNDF